MKRVFLTGIVLVLSSVALFAEGEVKGDTLSVLKEKKELLELHVKLTKLNMKLLDKKEDRVSIAENAEEMNKKADKLTSDYETSEKVSSTISDSKDARKLLAKTEKANKKLAKINKNIEDLENDIKGIERKIAVQRFSIQFFEK